MIKAEKKELAASYGHYVWLNDKKDILITVLAQFDFKERKWYEIMQRIIIAEGYQDEHVISSLYDTNICGQAVMISDDEFVNYSVFGKNITQQFIGGIFRVEYNNELNSFFETCINIEGLGILKGCLGCYTDIETLISEKIL